MTDIVIGGHQKHQTPRNDGICPTLTASMGMGGGYVPIILEMRVDYLNAYYDVYNKTLHRGGASERLQRIPRTDTAEHFG